MDFSQKHIEPDEAAQNTKINTEDVDFGIPQSPIKPDLVLIVQVHSNTKITSNH